VRDPLDPDGGGLLEESGEAWPDEPEEFDPHSLGPEIPSAPEPPDPTSDDVEVSPDLAKAFWAAVVFANVGLLGVSLGPMLVYFEGMTDLGLAVFLIGVLSLVFAYRRYHGYVHRDEGGD
jgi:F0F1-type ATP synthase assembly protein I